MGAWGLLLAALGFPHRAPPPDVLAERLASEAEADARALEAEREADEIARTVRMLRARGAVRRGEPL